MAKNQTNNSTNRTSDSTQKTTNRTQQKTTNRSTNTTNIGGNGKQPRADIESAPTTPITGETRPSSGLRPPSP